MILVRAPLRISFVGGGTDLPDFYNRYPGRVLSATINKYVYVVINESPLMDRLTAKYSKTESVSHPSYFEHPSIREALLYLGITRKGIEIGSFADLPSKTGLGSSSSFAVALLKGLHALLLKKMSAEEAARAACHLEIELLKEPIGKQDQYAAAYGGFNVFQFNTDATVAVSPVFLDYKKKSLLEEHLLLFFTGITRAASSILSEQRKKIDTHFETYKKMSDSVPDFEKLLLDGNVRDLGDMLHTGWLAKKSLSEGISNEVLDSLYTASRRGGAWGGKVLGAGGGGCLLVFAPPLCHREIRKNVNYVAERKELRGFREIPVQFVQAGSGVLLNNHQQVSSFLSHRTYGNIHQKIYQ
ncbi:MAG: D-glycero-alpha-D-manno-heptose-7-phosphate kinase [Parcubacteria group bacterium Gr01-1014_48]|nr:MAG: D-glycero-alpha-D-manno-heptose-7-phosphate kinase [Parcubacteria group bacterium Greene0416_14]TSC74470.1 MAG: D-glycero-alpha-D-manno-heptose-7-phosphate kinase [Parcubacteria group bacterium Gr01-1014_48]TSD01780.1 MAG: D-glycero-alpha-D-manno-heptose-7-phosphate kinase [Parcubacteria group bacterium Greene1014_15]TSD08494.1 MAG: D-glycero-alpha-D-manno-heptose-7-phosphate kinase [Parcubacteria group bacterium Greene0714_4]